MSSKIYQRIFSQQRKLNPHPGFCSQIFYICPTVWIVIGNRGLPASAPVYGWRLFTATPPCCRSSPPQGSDRLTNPLICFLKNQWFNPAPPFYIFIHHAIALDSVAIFFRHTAFSFFTSPPACLTIVNKLHYVIFFQYIKMLFPLLYLMFKLYDIALTPVICFILSCWCYASTGQPPGCVLWRYFGFSSVHLSTRQSSPRNVLFIPLIAFESSLQKIHQGRFILHLVFTFSMFFVQVEI